MGKSAVSLLQEYCAKEKIPPPTYEIVDSVDGGFDCKIEVANLSDIGTGRSKRDAKHQAAANLVKKMRLSTVNDEDATYQPVDAPNIDMVLALRDYCVQNMIPCPIFEIVQQAGTPDAPEFTAVCSIASIKRYGVSDKKKDARQKAAKRMFLIIVGQENFEQELQLAPLDARAEQIEAERYMKFKTYRELTDSGIKELPGMHLCDRHNFFLKFFPELKNEAKRILKETYDSTESQALDVLAALKLKPKITYTPSEKTSERMTMIELDCQYDIVFLDRESKVYSQIVDYFKEMLY